MHYSKIIVVAEHQQEFIRTLAGELVLVTVSPFANGNKEGKSDAKPQCLDLSLHWLGVMLGLTLL